MNIASTPSFCGKIRLDDKSYVQFFDKDGNLVKDEKQQEKLINELSPECKLVTHPTITTRKEQGQTLVYGYTFDTKDVTEIDEYKFTTKTPSGITACMYHSMSNKLKTDYNKVLNAYMAACQNDNITVSVNTVF